MDTLFTISEAAEKLGVSADTARRWEKKGLIKATRSENNYRVFRLEELQRVHDKATGKSKENNYKVHHVQKPSGYTAVDLFAGCGGTALGLENAGLSHLLLNEFDKNAAATLRKNRPNWNVNSADIHNLDFTPLNGKVDVLEGGFPCQAFSYAGKKMGFEDTRGTLFHEFARAVQEIQPKIAIGENVRGLLTHDGGRTLTTMVALLQKLGYRVAYRVMRSQYMDVPQKRERLLIFAVRKDLGTASILFPKEKDYTVSLREAIGDQPSSGGQEYSGRKKEIMQLIPEGGYWRDLPEEIQKEYMKASYYQGGGKTGMARRLSWDEPSLTLTCNPAQKQTERCHPSETRPLNVREYARIQTFPDNWQFAGSVPAQYRQIGNAVPANLGYYMGVAATAMLSGKIANDFVAVDSLPEVEALGALAGSTPSGRPRQAALFPATLYA
jgi:DNA (cytosine-5)-methyltransferase 1